MSVGGAKFTDIQGAHPILYYAVHGWPFNDAAMAGVWGVRKVIDAEFPPITRADALMEPYTDAQEIKIKIEAWQNNYAGIKRAILLAQTIQQIIFQYGVDYYNFVANNANPPLVTPTGSVELAMEFTLDVSSTDIVLTIEYHGKCYPVLWDWVLANATSAQAGASGTGAVTVTGLTQEVFNNAEYGVPGILGIFVGTGNLTTDDELGLKEAAGSKLQIKLAKIGETMDLQPISKRVEIKNTIAMFQNRYTDLQAVAAWRNSEQVITWQLANACTIVFDKCTKIAGGAKFNDSLGLLELKNEGSTFTDPLNGVPTNILFDDTNKKITFKRQGYV